MTSYVIVQTGNSREYHRFEVLRGERLSRFCDGAIRQLWEVVGNATHPTCRNCNARYRKGG